jgi:hypothetical protein
MPAYHVLNADADRQGKGDALADFYESSSLAKENKVELST